MKSLRLSPEPDEGDHVRKDRSAIVGSVRRHLVTPTVEQPVFCRRYAALLCVAQHHCALRTTPVHYKPEAAPLRFAPAWNDVEAAGSVRMSSAP